MSKEIKTGWDVMDEETRKRLQQKNRALALAIVAFIVLLFFVSLVRLSGG